MRSRSFVSQLFRQQFARYRGDKFISGIALEIKPFFRSLKVIPTNEFVTCAVQLFTNRRYHKPQTYSERRFPLVRGWFSSHYSSTPAPFLLSCDLIPVYWQQHQGEQLPGSWWARLYLTIKLTHFHEYRGLKQDLLMRRKPPPASLLNMNSDTIYFLFYEIL